MRVVIVGARALAPTGKLQSSLIAMLDEARLIIERGPPWGTTGECSGNGSGTTYGVCPEAASLILRITLEAPTARGTEIRHLLTPHVAIMSQ